MKRVTSILVWWVFYTLSLFAQDVQIKGTVINSDDGSIPPGFAVTVKGTTTGSTTNIKGVYTLTAPSDVTFIFTFVGMQTLEEPVSGLTQIDVALTSKAIEVGEVVVTALGVARKKRSLGYSVQEIGGDDDNIAKSDNFIRSLSGKVVDVNIENNTNFGGYANIIMRGSNSLTQNSQAFLLESMWYIFNYN
jgi:hypothetical protein